MWYVVPSGNSFSFDWVAGGCGPAGHVPSREHQIHPFECVIQLCNPALVSWQDLHSKFVPYCDDCRTLRTPLLDSHEGEFLSKHTLPPLRMH